MENLSRKLEKALKYIAVKVTLAEAGYHTLMLVGENGKIKHVRILKGLVIALILIQVLLIFAAVFVLFTSRKYIEENGALLKALAISQKNYLAMRDEKDILTARLVLAESILKGGTGANKSVPAAEVFQTPVKAETAAQGRVKVSVDNLKILYEAKSGKLNIQFDLKNAGTDDQYITGNAFVILKGNNTDQNSWLSVPDVPLISKKPSEINRGRRFSISRFKQVFLDTNYKSSPQSFKIATVFVFSVSGELLLEKDLPVEITTGET